MPFCTSCGNEINDGTKFCARCGTPAGASAGAPVATYSAPAVSSEPLDYTSQGDNLQVVRLRLKPGQDVYAEAGKMVYKTANVHWETRMTGESIGEKIMGAIKRKLAGESLFLTHFRTTSGQGEVGFAGDYPGRLHPYDLRPGQSIMVQRDSFICGQSSVSLSIALVKKLGSGIFGVPVDQRLQS